MRGASSNPAAAPGLCVVHISGCSTSLGWSMLTVPSRQLLFSVLRTTENSAVLRARLSTVVQGSHKTDF